MGVILSNDAQPVPEEAVSSRQFGGSGVKTGGIFGIGGAGSPQTTINETTTPYTPGPSTTGPTPRPTTDLSMIKGKIFRKKIQTTFLNCPSPVPRTLEGKLVIENKEYTPSLADHNSEDFKDLSRKIEEQLKNALFDQQTLNYGAADIDIKVLEFT